MKVLDLPCIKKADFTLLNLWHLVAHFEGM